jgi:phosphohistidine phosphatase SixA
LKVRAREEKLLAPGFSIGDLKRLLKKYPQQVLLLVGHEPDFTSVIGALTGASLKLSKGGVALLDLDGTKGRLLWLFPPRIAKA